MIVVCEGNLRLELLVNHIMSVIKNTRFSCKFNCICAELCTSEFACHRTDCVFMERYVN